MSGFNLLVGRLRDAWADYPRARQRLGCVPGGRSIFLTGTHRSGTTWFAKMLAASGVWYAHEPCNVDKGYWKRPYFTYVRPDAEDRDVDELFGGVLAGRRRRTLLLPHADHCLMPLRMLPAPVSRVLIKDPLACLLTAYLQQRFDLTVLVMFRHPLGFVSSVLRLGWPTGGFLKQFLGDEHLMADHLGPYASLLEAHAEEDTTASAAVLHGSLNTVLWSWVAAGVARPLVFEELCADPHTVCEALFADLGLPYDEVARAEHRRLTESDAGRDVLSRPHSVARDSRAMKDRWKSDLVPEQVAEVQAIWEQFPVPLYRGGDEWHVGTDQ